MPQQGRRSRQRLHPEARSYEYGSCDFSLVKGEELLETRDMTDGRARESPDRARGRGAYYLGMAPGGDRRYIILYMPLGRRRGKCFPGGNVAQLEFAGRDPHMAWQAKFAARNEQTGGAERLRQEGIVSARRIGQSVACSPSLLSAAQKQTSRDIGSCREAEYISPFAEDVWTGHGAVSFFCVSWMDVSARAENAKPESPGSWRLRSAPVHIRSSPVDPWLSPYISHMSLYLHSVKTPLHHMQPRYHLP